MTDLFVKIKGRLGNFNLNFEHKFESEGITVLYGPNGSGKSSIISAVGGFIRSLEISVILNGHVLEGKKKIPSYKRPIGIMFQDPQLFEHLTVNQNLDFAVKRVKPQNKSYISIEKEDLIKSLDLEILLKRYPINLSGGEKLRVALARTILSQPDYLLLDEPMSDLDIRYKAKLIHFLKTFNRKNKIPILYVTHSIEEISQIADEIVLINKGRYIESGSISKILNSYNFQNLVGKFEASSVLEGYISKINKPFSLTTLNIDGQNLMVPGSPGSLNDFVRVRIRSRDIIITPIKINSYIAENLLIGEILKIETEKKTAFSELVIELVNKKNENKAQILRVRITTFYLEKMNLSYNNKVYIYIRSVSIDRQAYHLFLNHSQEILKYLVQFYYYTLI